jgi:hypothetical protein
VTGPIRRLDAAMRASGGTESPEQVGQADPDEVPATEAEDLPED